MQLVMDGTVEGTGPWADYKKQAEGFICACVQKGSNNVKKTPGGLLWFMPWDNLQYVATATFSLSVYSQYLSSHHASLTCDAGTVTPADLTAFVKSQVPKYLNSESHGSNNLSG